MAYLHANQYVRRNFDDTEHTTRRHTTPVLSYAGVYTVQGRLKIRDHGLIAVKDFVATQGDPSAPEYCSPELLARRPIDDRTDVYSFGMVLIEYVFVFLHVLCVLW